MTNQSSPKNRKHLREFAFSAPPVIPNGERNLSDALSLPSWGQIFRSLDYRQIQEPHPCFARMGHPPTAAALRRLKDVAPRGAKKQRENLRVREQSLRGAWAGDRGVVSEVVGEGVIELHRRET